MHLASPSHMLILEATPASSIIAWYKREVREYKMYDYIRGNLAYSEIDHVVIEAHGIGYRIFCSNPSLVTVDEKKETKLYLHHHVREDVQLLYGFITREERRMFRLLLEVSGIGPKGATAIIGAATPQQIALAIAQEDVKFLTRFPGIGQKTAKRLILDLKDKLKAEGFGKVSESLPTNTTLSAVAQAEGEGLLEALEALVVLGFHEQEVLPILRQLSQENEGLKADQFIKEALKQLQRF